VMPIQYRKLSNSLMHANYFFTYCNVYIVENVVGPQKVHQIYVVIFPLLDCFGYLQECLNVNIVYLLYYLHQSKFIFNYLSFFLFTIAVCPNISS
jgi:hypothetical protein